MQFLLTGYEKNPGECNRNVKKFYTNFCEKNKSPNVHKSGICEKLRYKFY